MKALKLSLLLSLLIFFSACATQNQLRLGYSANQPPTQLTVDGSKFTRIGEQYILTVSAIDYNSDGIRYEFDWNGDGIPDEHTQNSYVPGTDVRVPHRWSQPGTYTISVIAKDDLGAASAKSFLKVTVLK